MKKRGVIGSRPTINLYDYNESYLDINDFAGVDYSHSQLFVDDSRATDMSNFIKKNGVTQKRCGWRELFQFEGNINGVWELGTTEKYLIVHCGRNLYSLTKENGSYSKRKISTTGLGIIDGEISNFVNSDKIKDEKSYGIVVNDILVFMSGSIFLCNKGAALEIDSTAYVPTVRINTIFDEWNEHSTSESVISPISYESINMIGRSRKERFKGISKNALETYVGENSITNDNYFFTYTLATVPYNILYEECYDVINDEVRKEIIYRSINRITIADSNLKIYSAGFFANSSWEGKKDLFKSKEEAIESGEKVYAYLDYGSVDLSTKSGQLKIVFNFAVIPFIDGTDTIYIEYDRLALEQEIVKNRILNCKFGILYGVSNNKDALFLSGNEEYPNYDWRSSIGLDYINEWDKISYFPDINYSVLGNETSPITGYQTASDGSLLVFKAPSNVNPTIYIRTASITTVNEETVEAFPIQVGNIGQGLYSTFLCNSLNGDTMIINNNGIFGVSVAKSIITNERYASSRSRLIDSKFCLENLEKCCSYVYDNKLMICNGEKCYVADARYTSSLSDELSSDFQYEWWIWDGIPARCFFEYEGELCFGTEEGQICKFEENLYEDITNARLTQSNGDLIYDNDNDLLVINEQAISKLEKINNGDIVDVNKAYSIILSKSSNSYYIEGEMVIILNNYIPKQYLIGIKEIMFSNISEGCLLSENTKYTIEVSDKYNAFNIIDLTGNKVQISEKDSFDCIVEISSGLTVAELQAYDETNNRFIKKSECVRIDGETYIVDKNGNKIEKLLTEPLFNRFKLAKVIGSDSIVYNKIIPYFGSTFLTNMEMNIEYHRSVECYFITKTFNFGTSVYLKKIKQLTIVPDTSYGTSVDFGYETSRNNQTFNSTIGEEFSFNNIDFSNISFGTEAFARAYCVRVRDSFNFIRFVFKNSDKYNCKMSNMTINYTIGDKSKGVV